MTTFLLVRHALCDPVGTSLAGRAPGIALNEAGRRQAERLGRSLSTISIDAVYSSPLERAWETARAIALVTGADVRISPALTDIDFGEWTRCTFDALSGDPRWRRFNAYRSGTRVPSGEHMMEVQARGVMELDRLRELHPVGPVVAVTHCDVVRAIVAYHAGIPLDLCQRLEIAPASVSVLELTDDAARILQLNNVYSGPAHSMTREET